MIEPAETMITPRTICGHCGKPLMECTCGTTAGDEWISPHLKDHTGDMNV